MLDVYPGIATINADSAEYLVYLQLGKLDGGWVIINVLWLRKTE